MTDNDIQLTGLKRKLDPAISSHSTLEEQLTHQTAILTQFISKLSQVTKGMDIVLDNKLATLRGILAKHTDISDIEGPINEVTLLLQKHSIQNEKNIRHLHDEFHSAGIALQKTQGLPSELRRNLRSLLKESSDSKDAVVQYVPVLKNLMALYQKAFAAKISPSNTELLDSTSPPEATQVKVDLASNHEKVVKRFSSFLSKLTVSVKYRQQVSKIKSELVLDISDDKLFDSFLAVFDVISNDLVQERNTAKVFLSTLSNTLSKVQSAVKNTITSNEACKVKHLALNQQLEQQIGDMANGLNQANSVVDIKTDINTKLQKIIGTLESKTNFEAQQQQLIENQLSEMKDKVDKLEEQSKSFEKRIQEQQAKSMQDALTKLANRAAFDDFFAREIVRYHHKKFDLVLAVVDLDDFKRINDTYGHTAGDKTLQVIANTLTKHIPTDAFCGRYGGEEFVIIMSHISKEQVIKKLDALRLNVARLPFKFKNSKVSITLSIGVSHIQSEDNVHTAFERADSALYKAKEKGKNTVIYL
jgi:diguanylate cyclase (GGDEF)-like protein